MSGPYRVREAVVLVSNGYFNRRERMFIAERLITVFGIALFWWPLSESNWRCSEADALRDIHRDVRLSAPLSAPKIIELSDDDRGAA